MINVQGRCCGGRAFVGPLTVEDAPEAPSPPRKAQPRKSPTSTKFPTGKAGITSSRCVSLTQGSNSIIFAFVASIEIDGIAACSRLTGSLLRDRGRRYSSCMDVL
jgi:hypothetical protein